MAKWKLTERDIKDQINRAKLVTRLAESGEPRVSSASYDANEHRIVLTLTNGSDFRFPISSVPELAAAPEIEIKKIEISPAGTTLRWKTLNADLSLAGLMMGIFGPRSLMAQIGSVGGSVRSPAKAAAARANGQKGGRPATDSSKRPRQTRVLHLSAKSAKSLSLKAKAHSHKSTKRAAKSGPSRRSR